MMLPEGEASLLGKWPESRRRGRWRGLEGLATNTQRWATTSPAQLLISYYQRSLWGPFYQMEHSGASAGPAPLLQRKWIYFFMHTTYCVPSGV